MADSATKKELRRPSASFVRRYGLALASVAGALLLDILFHHFNLPHPFAAFALSAIAITFWYAGTKPGIVAVLLSSLIRGFIFEGETSSLWRVLYELVFLTFAVLMIWVRRRKEALEVAIVDRTAELTAANEDLQRRQEQLDGLFELSPDAVILTDDDFYVLRVNKEFTRMFGYTAEEAAGQWLPDLIEPEELRAEALNYRTLLTTGERVELEAIRQRKGGDSFDVSVVAKGISFGFDAEFLERDDGCASTRADLLLEIQEAVRRMTERIDSLLQLGSSGQNNPIAPELVSFVLEKAIAAVKLHPDGRNVLISAGKILPVEADIDARNLESAIYNLLLNACQAATRSSHVPQVKVHVSEVNGQIYVTISDNGPGIPASVRSTLFDPFVTAGKPNGTGLGLTLARRIAEEHGGSVRLADSNPGRTVFTLSLMKNRSLPFEELKSGRASFEASRNEPANCSYRVNNRDGAHGNEEALNQGKIGAAAYEA